MTMLVVFDTTYGNTKIIADTIASRLGDEAMAMPVDRVRSSDLDGADLLVVGSPIIGWRPSQKMQEFLDTLHEGSLTGVKAASWADTFMRNAAEAGS